MACAARGQRGNALGLMAKHWTPGEVKTRLATVLGAEKAAEIQRWFVLTLLERLAPGPDWDGFLVLWPPEARPLVEPLPQAQSWQVVEQQPGHLGQKMLGFVRWAFREGYDRVVLLGSDAPDVPRAWVCQGLDWLDQVPVVLGPAQDGGYWFLGLRQEVPQLFESMPWSTNRLWAQTVQCLERLALPYARLPSWSDVDQVEDLHRLLQRLQHVHEPSLLRLREQLRQMLAG